MAKGGIVIINGSDKKLDRKLRALAPTILRKVIRGAASKSMKPVKKAAKANLKRNGSVDTGQLLKSLGAKTKTYRRTGTVVAMVGPRTKFKGQNEGRNPSKYAHLVELGFKHTGAGLQKVPAKPFMRPALTKNEGTVIGIYRRELAVGIERVGKQMGRKK